MTSPHTDLARTVSLAWQRAYACLSADEATLPEGWGKGVDRAQSDALAAWLKWHAHPEAGLSKNELVWYTLLERARVETLASDELPGMALNLQLTDSLAPQGTRGAQVYRGARALFGGQGWKRAILPDVLPLLGRRASILDRVRTRFAGNARPITKPRAAQTSMTESSARDILQLAAACLSEPERFFAVVYPLVQWLAMHVVEGTQAAVPNPFPPQSTTTLDLSSTDCQLDDGDKEVEVQNGDKASGTDPLSAGSRNWLGYAIYSRQWDEVRTAASFFRVGEGRNADFLVAPNRAQVRHLAHRLQRRLQAARRRTWSFDQEEGRLDSRRLARLIAPAPSPAVFRQESESPVLEACVTLLVDQSGSMDAKRRQMAALAIDLAVHTLESCRVSCEVLGFTTRYGAHSPIIEAWRRAGSPPNPGRLNALRHIVYKGATQPWRRSRSSLGLLLREGFGQENIDGEALDWAAGRLAARPEPRKILIVLSDGTPYDAATRLAQDRLYLEDHLRQVIAAIEASPIHLAGLGTGQDVGRFYRHALALRHPDAVAEALFEHLGDLLTRPTTEY